MNELETEAPTLEYVLCKFKVYKMLCILVIFLLYCSCSFLFFLACMWGMSNQCFAH